MGQLSPGTLTRLATPFDELLFAAQRGAPWAFTALFRELQPRLLRYLRARCPDQAEDVASDVWLSVVDGLGDFRGDEEGLRAWLFTIARRRVVDAHRRSFRRPADPVPDEFFAATAGWDDTEAVVLGAIEAQDAIGRIVSLLPPDQVDVILLRVVAGLSVETVAVLLDKKAGAVRALQYRALRRMARLLTPELDPA